MIEALWYGLIVSLSFIGFVSILLYFLLHTYSTDSNTKIIVWLPEGLSENDLYRAIYGIYLRKIIFGNLTTDNVVVLSAKDAVSSACEMCELKEVFSNFECLTYEELIDKLK